MMFLLKQYIIIKMKEIKIILVDENSLFLDIMRQFFLTVLQCEIIGIALNGEDFLSMKNVYEADIIFMDIDMSGTNGFQSVIHILKNKPQAKIVALSTYHNETILNLLLDIGYKGLVRKTNFKAEIIPVINKVLGKEYYAYSYLN